MSRFLADLTFLSRCWVVLGVLLRREIFVVVLIVLEVVVSIWRSEIWSKFCGIGRKSIVRMGIKRSKDRGRILAKESLLMVKKPSFHLLKRDFCCSVLN